MAHDISTEELFRLEADLGPDATVVKAGREVDLSGEEIGISLDFTVVTANRRDFEKIEGLRLEVR